MIVDWAENCEKIFLTKKISFNDPSDNKSKFKQETVYLKYLIEVMKLDQQRCFEEWKLISNGIASAFAGDNLQLEIEFYKLFKKAQKTRYTKINYKEKLKPIVIFQEEIDFLNNLDVPLWVRQYWGCLLFYYKFEIQNNNRVQKSSTLNAWCIRHTNYKAKMYGSVCQDAIAKYKISCGVPIITDFVKSGRDHYPSYRPEFLCESGKPAIICTNIGQLDEMLLLLHETEHICERCGEKFIVGSKTKRNLCDSCYAEYRKEYKTQNKRLERAKKADVDKKTIIALYDKGEK